ncbi:bifunctional N-succinyldiaminopimelate-aminotransferase/ acetylornithine transaminase protein [Caballeronia hypogeia]|uniref:Acetylornithine aminotransferase n=2 Tax=Caballeronia hypogeia TaxID=1777140 RepID=A0A158DXC7_9BURK|nr:bifunctional N-succinyldiaminopimelate-aminotransferase/ acetylornithine transaminase protein [Caballeronia hypogeia]
MAPVYAPAAIIPVRGQGSRVWDEQDREYIDLTSGIAVTAFGHAHPELVEALTKQAGQLWHIGNVFTNHPVLRLASRLTESTFADRAFFANSGAEANEAALKLARRVAHDRYGPQTKKTKIIAFSQSFHGRTLFSVSAGGQPKYSEGFGPLPQGIVHLPFNDIDAALTEIDADTCAVIVEPVQGEGGVVPATREFLQCLRCMCSKHDALLVFDEVQTGIGRTGSLFAYMDLGVTPDILTSAKALGNGFPIGAMLTTAEIGEHFTVGTHGSTHGGNPLAAAVADRVVEMVNTAHVLEGVRDRSASIFASLRSINSRTGMFRELRGSGLLIGAELSDSYRGRSKEIMTAALDEGVMILNAGPDVLRFAPALNIPYECIDEAFDRLEIALHRVKGAKASAPAPVERSA